jgi:hypothetical protein
MTNQDAFIHADAVQLLLPDDGPQSVVSGNMIPPYRGVLEDLGAMSENGGVFVEKRLHRTMRFLSANLPCPRRGDGTAFTSRAAEESSPGHDLLRRAPQFVELDVNVRLQHLEFFHGRLAPRREWSRLPRRLALIKIGQDRRLWRGESPGWGHSNKSNGSQKDGCRRHSKIHLFPRHSVKVALE